MAAASSQNTIARQWQLLKLLPSRAPGLEARVLTQQLRDAGFSVSKRTVERDLQDLSLLFPLQCNDKSMPFGWYWMAGADLDIPGISVAEALSLTLVEGQIRQLLPASLLSSLAARFGLAKNKLQALESSVAGARWPDKVASVSADMQLLAPKIDSDILRQVQQALLDKKQLEVSYHALHQNAVKQYRLNPLALVQRGQVSYLIASAEPYTDPLRFAIHRFKQVEITDTAAVTPADFNLQRYLASGAMEFSEGETITLEFSAKPVLANLLQETPLSADMVCVKLDNGDYHISASVHKGWQLNLWLMSQSSFLTVLAPQELRDKIKQQLTEALANY
ncbi:helix-turn-helix transcriptional regulator [Rheinheimera maricola]|uniref:WYL domain-containing protein n=1 Tax=Rheinheimera maricola TaxID=2793282 RepID=A0ABS7XEN9_9GAMM|nr:WYL domain-containing protein [Rheinheimera maricola]MBZ9613515.1 WYL domain-containing protein [Rheinheimera maricola]